MASLSNEHTSSPVFIYFVLVKSQLQTVLWLCLAFFRTIRVWLFLSFYITCWSSLEHAIQVVTQNHTTGEESNLMKIDIVVSQRGLATPWGRTFLKFLKDWFSSAAFVPPSWPCVRGHPLKFIHNQVYLYFTSLRKHLSIIIHFAYRFFNQLINVTS